MLGESSKPSTPEQVQALFPVLSTGECLMVAEIEERFPRWTVWPDIGYPQRQLWYARRHSTSMRPLVAGKLGDLPAAITDWINANSPRFPDF